VRAGADVSRGRSRGAAVVAGPVTNDAIILLARGGSAAGKPTLGCRAKLNGSGLRQSCSVVQGGDKVYCCTLDWFVVLPTGRSLDSNAG